MGVPAFSCSFFAVMVTTELEGMVDSVEQDTMLNEAFDDRSEYLDTSQENVMHLSYNADDLNTLLLH